MSNRPIFLIVIRFGYKYLDSVSSYVLQALKHITGSDVIFELADRIEEIKVPLGSIVFVIGGRFPKFKRVKGCFYILINLELLYNVRRNLIFNRRARKWINKKHKSFVNKARCFDMVLDFYHPQTIKIEKELRKFPIRVMPFLVNVSREITNVPVLAERKWDVCVVGTQSKRRIKVYNKLKKSGYRLSPFKSSDFQSVVSESKLTLNIHFQNCNIYEAPRIVQTLSLGCGLVSEPCYGLEEIIPNDCYCCVKYSNLVSKVRELLENPGRIQDMGEKAERYMQDQYDKKCISSWKDIVEDIKFQVDRLGN